jgi:hypothetical protein
MAVIQTTVNELLELTQGVKNIKVQNLRTTIDYANRKIISLQRHLENLRSAYTLIKQNIYRDQTFEDLNTTPDQYQTIDPIQSIQHYDVMPSDPDPRINWARRRLEESIALSKRHLEKIDEEIKSTSADITKLTYEKQQAIEELATIADVNVAVSRDNIVKSQYSITYMLYEIHKKYRDLSTDANGNRVFSTSPPIVRQYQILSNTFATMAARDPDAQNGTIVLDMSDPGSNDNEVILTGILNRRQNVLDNSTAVGSTVSQLANKMLNNVNNGYISQSLSRQNSQKRLPALDAAVLSVTKTIDNLVQKGNDAINNLLKDISPTGIPTEIFGVNLNSLSDSQWFSSAVTTKFQRELTQMYDGMPLCTPPPDSQDHIELVQNQENAQSAEDQAIALIGKQFAASAKTTTTTADAKKALLSASDELDRTIDLPPTGSNSSPTTYNMGNITYTVTNYHDNLVLTTAMKAYNLAQQYLANGIITQDYFNGYYANLTSSISTVTSITASERKS